MPIIAYKVVQQVDGKLYSAAPFPSCIQGRKHLNGNTIIYTPNEWVKARRNNINLQIFVFESVRHAQEWTHTIFIPGIHDNIIQIWECECDVLDTKFAGRRLHYCDPHELSRFCYKIKLTKRIS